MKSQKTTLHFKCRTNLRGGECDCNDRCMFCNEAYADMKCDADCNWKINRRDNRDNLENPGDILPVLGTEIHP